MNITAKEIIKRFEGKIPPYLAELWDNVGLQVGTLQVGVTGVLTTLDVTQDVVRYAIRNNFNLIVSHHPLLFKGIKQIDTDSYEGALLSQLIRHNITVYSAHTNYDIARGGLNDLLVKRLQLKHVQGLVKTQERRLCKFVVFVPSEASHKIRQVLGNAGAGYIGAYSDCSFTSEGTGRFRPLKGSNPYIGKEEQIESVTEERIETIIYEGDLERVVETVLRNHPYEEVAYDVYPLVKPDDGHYLGRIGYLEEPMTEDAFAQFIKKQFPKGLIRFAGAHKEQIHKVALCSGSGADFIKEAARRGADAYITGDVKYHDGQAALGHNLLVADIGHYGSEACAAEGLMNTILQVCPSAFWNDCPIRAFEEQKDFFFTL